MGRTLKRVPMDFNWPLNKVWGGYLNPHYRCSAKCKACDGSGLNPETHQISEDFYDFARTGARWCDKITQDEVAALTDAGRLRDFHQRFSDGKWSDYRPVSDITAAEVNDAEKAGGLDSHDAINRWILIKTRAKRLGVYGKCEVCGGECDIWTSPEAKELAENWKPEDPPEGEGYQLWETTSEGSPSSPVFATIEELCDWCADWATTFGSFKATAEEWRKMLDKDFVCHQVGNAIFL